MTVETARLPGNPVDLYLCRPAAWQAWSPSDLLAPLSDGEQARYFQLRQPARALQFLLSRYLLRQLLGRRLGQPAESLCLAEECHGRPCLQDGALQFNLSHSGAWLALAVGAPRLGIDLEQSRRLADPLSLARRYCHPHELAQLLALPAGEQTAAFQRLWSLKEAVLKAHGGGLQAGLARFGLDLQPPRMHVNQLDDQVYSLLHRRFGNLHLALACQQSSPPPISLHIVTPGLEIRPLSSPYCLQPLLNSDPT